MKTQLLREWYGLEYGKELIKESEEKNNGKIIIPAILQKADTKNQNGRTYPASLLQREIKNYDRLVRERRALGELDHPMESTISLDRVSHIVTEVAWEGSTVRGMIEVLDTPKGKILKSLLESGVKVGISSRGVGSTRKTNEGIDEVQDDFQLICFDMVSEPSTPGAFLNESINFDSKKVWSKADRIWRVLNEFDLRGK